jgi:hypothetical protein
MWKPQRELAIEPLDAIEIGAWGAKAEGILGVAKQSLHIELPAYRILGAANAREAYQSILALLLDHSVQFFLSPVQRWADIRPSSTGFRRNSRTRARIIDSRLGITTDAHK